MADRRHLIHTSGDLILVMAENGAVRLYGVETDGSLSEQPPAVALAVREARERAAQAEGVSDDRP